MQKIAEHLILPDLLLRENTQYQRMHIYLRQREKIKKKKASLNTFVKCCAREGESSKKKKFKASTFPTMWSFAYPARDGAARVITSLPSPSHFTGSWYFRSFGGFGAPNSAIGREMLFSEEWSVRTRLSKVNTQLHSIPTWIGFLRI